MHIHIKYTVKLFPDLIFFFFLNVFHGFISAVFLLPQSIRGRTSEGTNAVQAERGGHVDVSYKSITQSLPASPGGS